MEYYAIRIYRRELRRDRQSSDRDSQITGLLEDDAGHQAAFHSAEELWRLLERSVADGVPETPEHDA